MDPPGQPLHRRLSRYFWGFPPFLALVETIALAVHFQDMDMVGEAVQQSPGQAFRAEYLRPLIEQCSAPGSLDTSLSHAAGLIEIAACHA